MCLCQVERDDMMGAYYRRLTGDDDTQRLLCAQRWSQWEMATSRLFVDENLLKKAESEQWALQFARIEWFGHVYFLLPLLLIPTFTWGRCMIRLHHVARSYTSSADRPFSLISSSIHSVQPCYLRSSSLPSPLYFHSHWSLYTLTGLNYFRDFSDIFSYFFPSHCYCHVVIF